MTIGRQELTFGSGRLIDVREGPNVRRRYDSVSITSQLNFWQLDAFVARPWKIALGSFDDQLDHDQGMWGIYAVNNQHSWPKLDVYYLGYLNSDTSYLQGRGDEHRHTLGTRFWGDNGNVTFNWEAIIQFGRYNDQDIQAWSIASDTSVGSTLYPLSAAGVSANVASGDNDPTDNKLGTFNPIFPRGNYFSELAILGPRNFYNIQPYLTFQPHTDIEITTSINFYWRLSTNDGVYGPRGNLLNVDSASNRRYVATEYSLSAAYKLTKSTNFSFVYGRSDPAALVKQTGSRGLTDYVEFTTKILF
jgi:hypothetical protein